MKAERLVVDTNVLISAALSRYGAPAALLAQLLPIATLLFSRETFSELETRLWRPKFDRYISIEMRHALLHDLSAVAEWVDLSATPAITGIRYSREPDDDMFLWTALAGGAAMLVSGDADLLTIPPLDTLVILTPAQALQRVMTIKSS